MEIKKSMIHNFGGFTLDMDKIGTTSTSKAKIILPYTGKLPADLSDTTGAAIVITLQVGLTVNVLLTVERAGKKFRYPITVTQDEIEHILQGFFFAENGDTRRDTGLDRYSLGLYQGNYINWKRLTMNANGLTHLLSQLSPEKRASLFRTIEVMKQEEATAG